MAEKQRVLKICEDRVVKQEQLLKPGFFVKSKNRFEAWYYLSHFLQQVKPLGKAYYLPIYERFAMPVSPYQKAYYSDDDIKLLTNQDKVADDAGALSSLETAAQQRKNMFADFMGIAVMGIVMLLIIVVLLASAGKLNLGVAVGGG